MLQGEQYKKITLRTMPNDILEGEERYTLSLVSADNNGEISPSAGDATVIILADPGASGVISIATEVGSHTYSVETRDLQLCIGLLVVHIGER